MIEDAGAGLDRLKQFGDRVAAQIVANILYVLGSLFLGSLLGILGLRGWQRRKRKRSIRSRRPVVRMRDVVNLNDNRIEIHHHHYYNDPPARSDDGCSD